ncbi:MAG: ATP-binding protein [Saprospiraceae bacterium]
MRRLASPFKFLDSYHKEDFEVFFGREKDTGALYDALSGVKHLLVYGPSGAGKTSLIECGLRNQFSDADWYALTVRRGTDIVASVFARINEALNHKLELHPRTGLPIDPQTDFGEAVEALFTERYQPVYLLFDQFEELLISGREDEKRDFFTRLTRLIRYKAPCRVLLIMREEFIGHLSEFEPLCPSIFQHRFRLEKMRRGAVEEVLLRILEAPRYRAFFEVINAPALAANILSRLPDQRQEIELAHVQVFLSELWDRANTPPVSLPLLHEGLVKPNDNLETVLDSFLKKQFAELEAAYGDKAPLELLACMISERHTKLQLGEAALLRELKEKGITLKKTLSDLLQDLERRRIIRQLKSGGATEYEISHDALALVVGQNLTEEMKMRERAEEVYRVFGEKPGFLSTDDLDLIRLYKSYKALPASLAKRFEESTAHWEAERKRELEEAQRQAEQERSLREKSQHNERRARQRTRMAAGVSVLALGLALLAGWSYMHANLSADIARQKTTETQAALEKMEAANQARLKIEIKKYLDASERMEDMQDTVMARIILEEALSLDTANAEVKKRLIHLQ